MEVDDEHAAMLPGRADVGEGEDADEEADAGTDPLYDDLMGGGEDAATLRVTRKPSTTSLAGNTGSSDRFDSAASLHVPLGTGALTAAGTSAIAQTKTTSLVEEVALLQGRVKLLEAENETLKRNLGILYRTATSELQRKDDQIRELQLELASSPAAASPSMEPPPPPTGPSVPLA